MVRFTAFVDSDDDVAVRSAEENKPAPPPRVSRFAKALEGSADEDEEDEETSDEDDEDENIPPPPAARQTRQTRQRVPTDEEDSESGSYSEESSSGSQTDEDESESDASTGPVARAHAPPQPQTRSQSRVDTTLIPWAKTVGVDAQKMHLMQASLFHQPEAERVFRDLDVEAPRRRPFRHLNRKHSRDSDGNDIPGSSQRASFAHDLGPTPFAPSSRKYARIPNSASITTGQDGVLADAGLALGRSFRVGWGPSRITAHLGLICGPSTQNTLTKPAAVNLSHLRPTTDTANSLQQLFQLHLTHTAIKLDPNGIPFATPSPTLTFGVLAGVHPPQDRGFPAQLFRLGRALFDPLPSLPATVKLEVSVAQAQRTDTLRRRRQFSNWLQSVVSPTVDTTARSKHALDAVLLRLSGNQIEKAVDAALNAGHVHLATLLAQAGGDAGFREALSEQLSIWRTDGAAAHVSPELRQIYALLAGELGAPEMPVKEWDWLRALGAHMWYAVSLDAPIAEVLAAYADLAREQPGSAQPPAPAWETGRKQVEDGRFALMRLFAEPELSLSDALTAQSFSATPGDDSLPWHLHVILSRCLRVRDFADRQSMDGEEDEDEEDIEGSSSSMTADRLTSGYASQLEALGRVEEAVFVLLHLKHSLGRQKAIKDLLSRQVSKFGEYPSRLMQECKIPRKWLEEAKAVHAQGRDDLYAAWQHYLAAEMWDDAHDVAVKALAPEAVVCHDMTLLHELFERMIDKGVRRWTERGQVYVEYAHVISRLPELSSIIYHPAYTEEVEQEQQYRDQQELDKLVRSVPRLLMSLPELLYDREEPLHKAAKAQMERELVRAIDGERPLAVDRQFGRMRLEDEGAKLKHLQASALERFSMTVESLRAPLKA